MKKIMFDDRLGLTDAVLDGRKTTTRRFAEKVLVEDENGFLCWTGYFKNPRYKPGEVVAVAQRYCDIKEYNPEDYEDVMLSDGAICEASHPYAHLMREPGWGNKMFVRADLMPHQIRITSIRVERLQDISDEDCLREGIIKMTFDTFSFDSWKFFTHNPREAFAALIDKVSGKGTWNSNPFVFVYEFELVK